MNFETAHGTEDTLRELLRIKRSVTAMYNTQVCILYTATFQIFLPASFKCLYSFQVNMMSAQMLAAGSTASGTVADLAPGAKDGMRMLEAKAAEMSAGAISKYFLNECPIDRGLGR